MTAKTRAQQLAEKAARIAAQQEQPHHPQDTTVPHTPRSTAAADTPLAKPVRSTLDLPPATHRDLQAWLGEAAVRLGRARVTKQDVLEALVKRLMTDETLAKLILSDLKERQ
jgi:hypothetical protein